MADCSGMSNNADSKSVGLAFSSRAASNSLRALVRSTSLQGCPASSCQTKSLEWRQMLLYLQAAEARLTRKCAMQMAVDMRCKASVDIPRPGHFWIELASSTYVGSSSNLGACSPSP